MNNLLLVFLGGGLGPESFLESADIGGLLRRIEYIFNHY